LSDPDLPLSQEGCQDTAQFDGANDKNLSIDDDLSLMYISTDVDGLSVKDCRVKLSEEFNRKVSKLSNALMF